MLKQNLIVSLFLLCACVLPTYGLESDRTEPIKLDGPTCITKLKLNQTICDQGVTITQGSLVVRSQHAIIYHAENKIERVEMKGAPVYLEQEMEGADGKMIINANYMDYRMLLDKVFLKGKVSVESSMGLTEAESMELNLETQEIIAGGSESGQQFHMTIDPEKKQ